MSLLLQALQKAAKNREANQQPPEATTGFATTSGSTLELEPGEIEPPTPRAREFDLPAEAPPTRPVREEIPEPSPQQAAVVVGAAAAAKEPGFSVVEWARDHPVHVFAILSGIFLAFYFVYILVEINYPGFWSRSGSIVGPSSSNGPIARNPIPQRDAASGPAPSQAAAPMPDLVLPPAPGQPAAATVVTSTATPSVAGPSVPPPAPAPETKPAAAAAAPTPAPAQTTAAKAAAPPPETAVPRSGTIARSDDSLDRVATPKRRNVVPAAPVTDRLTVKTTDDGAAIQTALGEAYELLQKGQLAPAQQAYERVLAADTRNIDALLGLASVAWQQGQTEKAAEHFYRVLQLDPHNAHAQSGLIGLMGRIDPTSSETRLKQLIAREPSGGLYFTLGNLYAGERQWAPAQQAYFQAFQLEPTNPDYAFNLAVGLEHLGQSKVALGYYRKALDLSFARGHAGFDQKQVIARIGELSAASE